MKRIFSTLFGLGLIGLQGCSAAPQEESSAQAQSDITGGSAWITVTSTGVGWYCAHAYLTNSLSTATTDWQILVDLKGATMTGNWNSNFTNNNGIITFYPGADKASVAPNGTAELMFCANRAAGAPDPAVKAFNMKMAVFQNCATASGVNPTLAGLAVAMATDLGRWEPDLDLAVPTNSFVTLAPALTASGGKCYGADACKNTKALLGQQQYTPDQNSFNVTNYMETMKASFNRQRDLLADLTRNHPTSVPTSNYKLTLVGGPVSMGYGYCGPHYIYQVDYATGTNAGKPLSTTDAANLDYTLCFYGGPCTWGNNTSANPYLGIIKTGVTGCPTGKTCIAIDPGDGDNSSTSTTTAGSAPTYPKNVVYDPANTLLGTQCITTRGLLGTMVSKCSLQPDTCGNLYCIAN